MRRAEGKGQKVKGKSQTAKRKGQKAKGRNKEHGVCKTQKANSQMWRSKITSVPPSQAV
jgi:hypothetical protein